MDITDIASEREIKDRELALRLQRTAQPTGVSASHCIDCEAPIPQGRQDAIPGVTLCVECQTIREYMKRGYA